MAKVKAVKKTRAQLQRQIDELTAGLNAVHQSALMGIKKAVTDCRMGSGVLVQLTAVGGGEIIPAVMVRDGLSAETIAALSADIKRSLELTKSGV